MGDGKLVFDTKIDAGGFEKDAKKLEGAKFPLGIDGEGVKRDIEEAVQAVNPTPVKIETDADTAPAKRRNGRHCTPKRVGIEGPDCV